MPVHINTFTRLVSSHFIGIHVATYALMTMLVAVAEMERDLLVERTQAGLQRARSQGKRLGRPVKTTNDQRQEIRSLLAAGRSVSDVARQFNVSRASIIAIRTEAEKV
jgi:putative DNA-invertase from lambdoid prophage Rac